MPDTMTTDISILLPTRGRTHQLDRSIRSLVSKALQPDRLQILLAFDDDDTETSQWFVDNTVPYLDEQGVLYTIFQYPRLGYGRLNEYVNGLAKHSLGRWLMFWNDDAVMESQSWDQAIAEHTEFNCLRIPTHNHHPYAIFPIVPRQWYEIFGYLSAHQISDAWISQISYMLDIVVNIDVQVTHDRFDITGNNEDETYKNRIMFEGRPSDPRDFNHVDWRARRFRDAQKIAALLEKQGRDISWFISVAEGRQDPWDKMVSPEYDPNRQLMRFKTENANQPTTTNS